MYATDIPMPPAYNVAQADTNPITQMPIVQPLQQDRYDTSDESHVCDIISIQGENEPNVDGYEIENIENESCEAARYGARQYVNPAYTQDTTLDSTLALGPMQEGTDLPVSPVSPPTYDSATQLETFDI